MITYAPETIHNRVIWVPLGTLSYLHILREKSDILCFGTRTREKYLLHSGLFCITISSRLCAKTKIFFICSNSSFSECVRNSSFNRISIYTQPITNDINPDCSQRTSEGKCKYETTPVLLSGGDHTFSDSEFKQCKHSGYGGAIDQTNGGILTIKRCIFDTCSCTERGGAVSFRGAGTCIQEDNLYSYCSSTEYTGGFDSYEPSENVVHNHKRCRYLNSEANCYAHFDIQFSSDAVIESNMYIRGTSPGDIEWSSGTVVNYHAQGSIVHLNSLFLKGKAHNGGGLSFLSFNYYSNAEFFVKFCFFFDNHGTDNTAKEIYFDGNTSSNANKNKILHSFTATPGSTVYIQSNPSLGQDWLPSENILANKTIDYVVSM